ncbi:MAG: glycosyltransferase family 2 protein [Thermodesulfovibrionales bacterium]|nr:glycosyltransferase family 2 protein [Thermodesulfovibrionales bacterium]
MNVSVIIPTLNGEKYISKLIERLWEQTKKPEEVLIIDSSSVDRTLEISRKLGAKVIKINRKSFDHGGTRNYAIKNTKSETVVLLTQDAIPKDSYFLQNLTQPLSDPLIPLSYGRHIPYLHANPIEIFSRKFNYPDQPSIKDISHLSTLGIKTFFCSNVCSALRKKEFFEVGGFPDNIIMNEDMILAAKLILKGYKVAYQPSAEIFHSHNYSIKEYFQRFFDIGVSMSMNKWLLQKTNIEKEGFRFLIEQTRYLINQKKFFYTFYGYLLAVAKFSGYRLGLVENYIPISIKKTLSMNKNFWDAKILLEGE